MSKIIGIASPVLLAASLSGAAMAQSQGAPVSDASRALSTFRYTGSATTIWLPEGVCDGVQAPIPYQQVRDGKLFKGTFAATSEIACVDGKSVFQGRFVETARDSAGLVAQSCAGILRLELTEEGLDARWRVLEPEGGACASVGREYVSYDMLTTDGSRGSFISLANYASDALRPYATYRVIAPIACFQRASGNSERIAVLAEGTEFLATQGSAGTNVYLDANRSPYLQTKVGGTACFVRAGFKYVTGI